MDGQDATFTTATVRGGPPDAIDAALITNISGTTYPENLLDQLATVPVFWLSVEQMTPHEDVIATRQTLDAFEKTVRKFFSELEERHKPLQRLHLFGGLPVSAAVTLGRSLKAADLRPTIVLYDLARGGYSEAMRL